MKKLLFSALSIFGLICLNAQEEGGFGKGSIFLSGGIEFSSQETNSFNQKSSVFGIVPRFGYFITDNIALGAKVGFTSTKFEQITPQNTLLEESTFAAGVFGRYYFTPANKFSLFGELSFDYLTTDKKLPLPEETINGFAGSLGLGFNYFIGKNFALEAYAAALSYSTEKSDLPGAEADTDLSFGAIWDAPFVGFGVLYKF